MLAFTCLALFASLAISVTRSDHRLRCHKGQYLTSTATCLPCPRGTFMPYKLHTSKQCISCLDPELDASGYKETKCGSSRKNLHVSRIRRSEIAHGGEVVYSIQEASSTNLTCPRNYYLDVTQQRCSRCPACSFLDQEAHAQTSCDHCSQRQPDNRLVYCPKRCDDEAPGALPTWARFIVGALVMVAAPFLFIMSPLLLNKLLNS
ncbi:unnamed protein product [Lymnaea stagnalis]|uniref:TNFR-Cys domain-containing protein n=1 Tax=Lymnaea stagnalis TaxID=6523 RepID=A0AAV2HG32_LYMST